MPLRNVATNYTFEQQRQEINLLAADVDTLDTSVTALQGLQATETSDSPTFTNLTLSGYLAGPATLTIDPAAVGDNTGTVVIAGNLQVDGTTTTINSTTMTVDDLNITLASGAANAAAADGAGLTVDGANATLLYNGTTDEWAFNKSLTSLSVSGTSTLNGQLDLGANMQFTAADPELEFNNGGPRFKVPAANTLSIHSGGGLGATTSERLRIDSDGRVTVFNGGAKQASEFNAGANQFVITNNDNCGITIDSTSNTSGSIHFADGPSGNASYRGIIEYDHSIDSMKFYTSATLRLSMNSVGTFNFTNGLLVENGIVDTTARNGIQAVNLDNGMVHYFQSSATGTWKPNFRVNSTNTLNNAMNIGDFCSPTMIVNKQNSAHYADSVQVDGSDITVDWLGGPPTDGGGNNTWDIYSYTILKTGAQAFKCWASVSNYNQ